MPASWLPTFLAANTNAIGIQLWLHHAEWTLLSNSSTPLQWSNTARNLVPSRRPRDGEQLNHHRRILLTFSSCLCVRKTRILSPTLMYFSHTFLCIIGSQRYHTSSPCRQSQGAAGCVLKYISKVVRFTFYINYIQFLR